MTLPIILALQQATPAEHRTIESALGNPNSGEDELAAIASILTRYGTLRETMAKAERHADAARAALAAVPASLERDILLGVPEFCTARAY